MIVIMRRGSTDTELDGVCRRARELGIETDAVKNQARWIVTLSGEARGVGASELTKFT